MIETRQQPTESATVEETELGIVEREIGQRRLRSRWILALTLLVGLAMWAVLIVWGLVGYRLSTDVHLSWVSCSSPKSPKRRC